MSELLRLHVIPGGRADQPPKKKALKEAPKAPAKEPAAPEPLWREVLGGQLRELRRGHQESLAETAARAGISPQYLSEVERGLKEPSSEMIAAVAGALGTTLGGLAESVADVLREQREAALPGSRHDLAVRRELGARRDSAARRPAGGPVLLALAA
jgi:transcriptional regulator with XRE-family HTH domain